MKIIVIGAGSGGYVAAIRAAQRGADVTLIEKEQPGGTCLNWGCIPSKIFKQTADTLNTIRHADNFCVSIEQAPVVNFERLQERVRTIISSQTKGIISLLKKHGVIQVAGTAKLSGQNEIRVDRLNGDTETFTFDKLILATGSKPAELPFLPFDGKTILSSDDIFRMKKLPKSITIVGGGVIGCEFASILNSFGCKVILIESLDRLLPVPSVDEECSRLLSREMKKQKIAIKTKTTILSAETKDEFIRIEIGASDPSKRKGTEIIESEKLLICIGRTSTATSLEPEKAGVKLCDRGWIVTNDFLQTSNQDIYAIGDVLGPEKVMLAHTASTEAEYAVNNCLGDPDKAIDYSNIPSAIFTMPEIGCVGLSEVQAVKRYGKDEVGAASVLFRTLGKPHIIGEIAGQAKLVFTRKDSKIIGAHIAGPHATDLLGETSLAVTLGISLEQLSETIHAHPTLAEIMLETAHKAKGRALHG